MSILTALGFKSGDKKPLRELGASDKLKLPNTSAKKLIVVGADGGIESGDGFQAFVGDSGTNPYNASTPISPRWKGDRAYNSTASQWWDATGIAASSDSWTLSASSAGATWGSIGGTLSSQSDLQSALDAKLEDAPEDGKTYGRKDGDWSEVTGGGGDATWGSITGTLSSQTDLASALGAKLDTSTAASTYQPLDGDLTAIAALLGTAGILKKTAANTWTLDTSAYLTANQSITISGDVSGSGTTAISATLANSGVTAGSYGDASHVSALTIDAKGRATVAASTSIQIAESQVTNLTSDLSAKANTSALGTAAYTAATDYATASQGTKADSALQPTGSGASLTGITASQVGAVPTSRMVNGHALTSDVTVSKSDVGLSNCDNTSDANKPISTAQAAALALKANASDMTTALASKAAISHSHAQSDVTGLADVIAAKANSSDVSSALALKANASDVTTALAGKAPSSHTHAQADVTGLSDALTAKANASDVATALAGKAATSHSHAQSDVTGLASALAAKADAATGGSAVTATSYTLALADAGSILECTSSSAVTVTVPTHASVAFSARQAVTFVQTGAGQITVAGASGVTVLSTATLKSWGQGAVLTLLRSAAADDTWILTGERALS